MEKLNAGDITVLTKTILSGLPGVGKSFLTNELCKKIFEDTGIMLESVSSDNRFREVRRNENHPVTINFMKEHNIPKEDFPLLIKTTEFIKKYGESCFRDLEADVIINMLDNGEFIGKIPNLGGKAVLHSRTADALKKGGYNIVYLRGDVNVVAKHISSDFEKALDGAPITRSNINDEIMQDVTKATPKTAKTTPRSFVSNRLNRLMHKVHNKNNLSPTQKDKKELSEFWKRIKARDISAQKIMTRMLRERDKFYEQSANIVIDVIGDKETDIASLLKAIRPSANNTKINPIDLQMRNMNNCR